MIKSLSTRQFFALIAIICLGLLATAWYLQYGPERQQPCPLCILQRYLYMLIGVVALLAAAQGPQRTGTIVYAAIVDLLATAGLGIAIWQVSKGDTMTSCLADPIGEFVNGLPSANWWPEYLFANGGCADKIAPVFGVPVPVWSLIWFAILLALVAIATLVRLRKNDR